MSYRGLHEIVTQRTWDMYPNSLMHYKELLDKNLSGHIPFVMEHEQVARPFMLTSREQFREQLYVGNARYIKWWEELRDDDQIINVVRIDGPVTRNGGACSYGSKEIRDLMMQAADMKQTIGHIILIDSPGGSSKAKYDFEQAIAYLREKNQPVVALVDGMACSAAYALASLCNEIYVTNENNTVGCIGTMAAFYYTPDGAVNEKTKEVFVERYAEGSPYKNKTFRALEEGDDSLLMEELNQSADDFKQMVRKYRPQVTDEQLLGLDYKASEVMGTMADGISNLQACVDRILELSGNPAREEPGEEPVPGEEPAGVSDDPDDDPEDKKESVRNEQKENPQNNTTMSKNYENIRLACEAGALESDKNGLYLQTEYCEKLEEKLEQADRNAGILDAKMKEIATLNELVQSEKQAHEEAMQKASEDYAEKVAELEASLKEAQENLKAAQEKLAEKESELEELASKSAEAPKPEAPKSNSMDGGVKQQHVLVCNASNSAEQNRKALKERMETLRRLRNG